MMSKHWAKTYLPPALVVMLAWVLRVDNLGGASLWQDELGTLYYVSPESSWLDTILQPLSLPAIPIPPLFFLLTRACTTIGYNEFMLRLPSALFATATIPIVYALGRSFFNRRIAIIGAFFLAIAPLHIRYAQEARSYAMLTFLSMLSLYLFWRALGSRNGRWWLAFVAATTANLYTHFLAVFPWGAMCLFGVGLSLWRNGGSERNKGSKHPQMRQTRFRFRRWHFLVSTLAILLLSTPLLPYTWRGLASERGLGAGTTPVDGGLGWSLESLISFLRLFGGERFAGAGFYTVLFVLGTGFLAMKRREILLLTWTWIAVPLISLLSLPFSHRVLIRYFLFALPVYLLVAALGLESAIRYLERWLDSTKGPPVLQRVIALALNIILLLGVLVGGSLPAIADYQAESRQNWRDATRLIQAMADPGDALYVVDERQPTGIRLYLELYEPDPDRSWQLPVRVLRLESDGDFSLDDHDRGWIVYLFEPLLFPGGLVDTLLEAHSLWPPLILESLNVPQDSERIAPVSYENLTLIRLEPDGLGNNMCEHDSEQQFREWLDIERTIGIEAMDVNLSLGLYAYYCGDLEEAIQRLSSSRGLARREDNVWLQLHLAGAYRMVGKMDEATATYERVLDLDEGNEEAHQWLLELRR